MFILCSKKNIVSFFISFLLSIISCSNIEEPEIIVENEFSGQLEADIDHAVLKSDGTLWAWGSNSTGQLGNGTMAPSKTPMQVLNLKNVVAFDFLEGGAIAADKKGDIWFWGNRLIWDEQLYDTTVTIPKKISLLTNVKCIEMYGSIIYILREDGTVWKINWDHNTPTKFIIPERISELSDICQISGDLAMKLDGTLCEFPNRVVIQQEKKGLIQSLQNLIQVSNQSRKFTVILKDDFTVWTWGDNCKASAGSQVFSNSDIPVKIEGLNDIKSISVNGHRCLALKKDGTVWFWGIKYIDSVTKQLIQQTRPIKIEGLENVQLIHSGGGNDNIVMKTDKTYWTFDTHTLRPEKVNFD